MMHNDSLPANKYFSIQSFFFSDKQKLIGKNFSGQISSFENFNNNVTTIWLNLLINWCLIDIKLTNKHTVDRFQWKQWEGTKNIKVLNIPGKQQNKWISVILINGARSWLMNRWFTESKMMSISVGCGKYDLNGNKRNIFEMKFELKRTQTRRLMYRFWINFRFSSARITTSENHSVEYIYLLKSRRLTNACHTDTQCSNAWTIERFHPEHQFKYRFGLS